MDVRKGVKVGEKVVSSGRSELDILLYWEEETQCGGPIWGVESPEQTRCGPPDSTWKMRHGRGVHRIE